MMARMASGRCKHEWSIAYKGFKHCILCPAKKRVPMPKTGKAKRRRMHR